MYSCNYCLYVVDRPLFCIAWYCSAQGKSRARVNLPRLLCSFEPEPPAAAPLLHQWRSLTEINKDYVFFNVLLMSVWVSVGGNHDKTQLERKQNNNYNDSNNEMQPWSRQGKKQDKYKNHGKWQFGKSYGGDSVKQIHQFIRNNMKQCTSWRVPGIFHDIQWAREANAINACFERNQSNAIRVL